MSYMIMISDMGPKVEALLAFSIIKNQSNVHLTKFKLRLNDLKTLEIYVCT